MAPLLGSASVQQKGRRANVAPGQWCIYDTTDIYSVDNPSRVEHLIVMLPKEPFVQRGLVLDRLMARPLGGGGSGGCSGGSDPGRGAIARLALQTMRCAHHELPDMNDSTASGVGDTIIQLVALSLLDLAGTATAASQKAQQRDRIKQHVAARLGHPDLSVDSIAAALNCSRRQLYNAFAEEPDGVAGYILNRRLQACRASFDDRAQGHRSITDIALGFGFSNMAHFSRVFRAHLGLAPSDYRRLVIVS